VVVFDERVHLNEIADFVIRSERFVTDHELDVTLGEFSYQPMDKRDDHVVRMIYTEDDLELRIALNAMATKTLVSVRIGSTEGLEDGDRRTETPADNAPLFK